VRGSPKRSVHFAHGQLRYIQFWVRGPLALKLLLLVGLASQIFARPAFASEPATTKNVLLLYSFSDRSVTGYGDVLKSQIRSHTPSPVNFYVEYLESRRFDDQNYERGLVETLRDTYGAMKLDLIIVDAYPALQFALRHRSDLFPNQPVVFFDVDGGRIAEQKWPGVTGVTETIDVRRTIDLALHLHPDTNAVAVITNKSEFERYWLGVVHGELLRHQDKVMEIDLVGFPPSQLLEKVAALPPHTVVLFQEYALDSSQPVIGAYDVLAMVGQRLPTYCIFPVLCLNRGGIGGADIDITEQVSLTADVVRRVLAGELPDSIPIMHGTSDLIKVDWRQLRRWNIPESALPPGTIVLYREPTAWEKYEKYIVAAFLLIIVQAGLIIGLLWQRARKRSATEDLRRLGGRLVHAHEEERARIARELHDDFSQRLAVQSIELTQLGKHLPESEVEERARALRMLKETKEMSADMRSLSHQLHSSRLELVGLVPAISGLCEEITKKYKVDVRFTEHEYRFNISKDGELCLFRVAQAALANVVKHSGANSAHVELGAKRDRVSLRISDAGKGFDPDLKSPGAGIGLIGMRERLRLVGGSLSIRSGKMRGTEILASIPLSTSTKEDQAATLAEGRMES
jgi:signal transduction histidine kinase